MKESGHIINPKQALFIQYFIDPESKTFSNCLQSGIAAGFSPTYAENIASRRPKWFLEAITSHRISDDQAVMEAEESLRELRTMNIVNETLTEGGEVLKKRDAGLASVKLRAAEITLRTLAKDKYSERKELTGAGEAPLIERAAVNEALSALDKNVRVAAVLEEEAQDNSFIEDDTESKVETGGEITA